MIAPQCARCPNELNRPGAVLFSPPFDEERNVRKLHLCVTCWDDMLMLLGIPLT